MALESLAAVHARIASISGAVGGASAGGRGGRLGASATTNSDFAAALAQAAGTTSAATADATATQLLPRRTNATQRQLLPAHRSGATAAPSGSGTLAGFVSEALTQSGKPYVFGAEVDPNDPNPKAFDCSELVQWAARKEGVAMREGSWEQYLQLKEQGQTMSVEEALRTPGALLFSFPHEPRPGEGRPSKAHVAISLGDGRTIEARGRKYGVGVFSGANRFQYGGMIPGLA